jgi:multidrug resistance efflux pump
VLRLCDRVVCLQVSAEQGRVSQLQAENAAGRSELENLRSTVTELRQQLEGSQAAKVKIINITCCCQKQHLCVRSVLQPQHVHVDVALAALPG